jgi:putative hydrolase of the HAD superfamily
MQKIVAILFDFDGVLTTDKTGTQSISNYICQKANIDLEAFKKYYYPYNDDLLNGKITHNDMWSEFCFIWGEI